MKISHSKKDPRYSRQWKQTSLTLRRSNPLCSDPFGWHSATGSIALATSVHHIEAVAIAPKKAFSKKNLICVCERCHKALHSNRVAVQLEEEVAKLSQGDRGIKKFKTKTRPTNLVNRKKIDGIFRGWGIKFKGGVLC